jgi:hypothetical protein
MSDSAPHFFETTVIDPDSGAEGTLFSVPASVLQVAASAGAFDVPPEWVADLQSVLGIRVGQPLPSAESVPDVFFASLSGRTVPFDDFSFQIWHERRVAAGDDDPSARFALQLSTRDWIAIEQSPVSGQNLIVLASRGVAWTVGGWESVIAEHPLRGLGIVVVGEFGIVIGTAARAVQEEVYIALRYHLRRLFNVPPNWRP